MQLVVVIAVMSAVSTVITMSITRFQVFFFPSFMVLYTSFLLFLTADSADCAALNSERVCRPGIRHFRTV